MYFKTLLEQITEFQNPLNEATDMLDISILNADKVFTTDAKIKEFFTRDWEVEEKFDGTKLTVWRNDTDFDENDYTKNWVIAYKGHIQYSEEFRPVLRSEKHTANMKKHSIGVSQYAHIHSWLGSVHAGTKEIHKNTEFFIEFIQNKVTTTRQYSKKHGMFLIAHSPATATITAGILKTKPTSFHTDKITDKYAKILKLDMPPKVFEGKFSSAAELKAGILNDKLRIALTPILGSINYETPTIGDYLKIKKAFLDFESSLGGKTEGVVLKSKLNIYKFLQDDQHDKELRQSRKTGWQSEDKEIDNRYWGIIKKLSDKILGEDPSHANGDAKLEYALKGYLERVYKITELRIKEEFGEKIQQLIKDGIDEDAAVVKILDDLHLTGKLKMIDSRPEHNNALLLGRFQPLTRAHVDIIYQGLDKFNKVVVCIVKADKEDKERNPFSLATQESMFNALFGKSDRVEIMTHSTGNIMSIINKAPENIMAVLAGSDRVEAYANQLKKMPKVKIVETKRSDEDISATKVRKALLDNDVTGFRELAPKEIWHMFEKLRSEMVGE